MADLDEIPAAPVDASRAKALRELYEHGPLYRKYPYTETRNAVVVVVDTIRLYCPVCRHDQPFGTVRDRNHYFQCRACQKYWEQFYVQFGETDGAKWVMKVGQYPPAAERVPKELETRLSGPDLDFYRKALRSRTFGFGLASLAYLRRVVENRTNDLLDLIADAASQQNPSSELPQRVADAKANYQFDQKVELASMMLPASLKPGGMNPLDALHDLASAGIHRFTEEQCLDHFDTARTAFEYLFKQLQVDREAAREYVESMNKLQQARSASSRMSDEPRGEEQGSGPKPENVG
jgi:hypothetical protein